MIKNVAIYCRVSTEEQKKFGLSVIDQKDSLTKYCKQNNYKIYGYFIDEGVSASSISKRKEFLRLLDNLDHIDLILFTKLDRFSRNVRDANNILVTLDEHNTSFKAIDEDDVDVSTADGRFIFNLKVNLAEREINKDSERINRVNKYKYEVAKTVCTGQVPYGYDIDENKKMVVNKEKANQIKELYNHYLKSNNLNETTKWFSNNYLKRSTYSIKKYLSNSCYIGQYRKQSGEIINDFCEGFLEKEIYFKVQKMLEKNRKDYKPDENRKRHNPTPYIFSGMLKCPVCKCNLSGKVNTSLSHYYNCKKHEKGSCSNKKCISEKDIENYLKNNIKNILEDRIIKIKDINKNRTVRKIDINNLKNKINKLTSLYMDDLVDIDYYKSEYISLNKELEKAKEEEDTTKKISKVDIDRIKNLLNNDFLVLYDTLDNLEKRRLWTSIIDYIIVKDKNDIDVIVY